MFFNGPKLFNIGISRELITAANGGIDKLQARLVNELDTSCVLPDVIVQSSVQVFFQGHIRRALMFIEGGHDAYLAGRGLVAYACARAIYETFACVLDFCNKLTVHLADGDFEKTVAFIHERQFAARMEDFVREDLVVREIIDNTAINILTAQC